MTAKEILGRLPTFWRLLKAFILRPRQFPHLAVLDDKVVSVKESLAWIVGFSLLLVNLYGVAFGSIPGNLFEAITGNKVERKPDGKISHPTISDLGFVPGFGIGVKFSSPDPDERQQVEFRFGAGVIVLDGVKPSELSESAIVPLLLLLYAFSFIVCIHYPARLLRGKASFVTAARQAELYFAYLWLTGTIAAVSGTLLFVRILHLRGWYLLLAWAVIVLVPMVFVSIRSFFAVFSEIYQVSKGRVFVACLAGWLVSFAVFPVMFVPVLYGIVRFTPLWKSVL